jgi:hypothetical protein
MKYAVEIFFRIALFVVTFFVYSWAIYQPLSNIMNLSIIVGGELLVFPLVWLGRKMLDRQPTASRASWITIFVHYALVILLGVPLIRAVVTSRPGVKATLYTLLNGRPVVGLEY